MVQFFTHWAASPFLFWILWAIELAAMLVWLFSDLKNTHLPVNPSVFLGFGWLLVALLLRLSGWQTGAMIMVGIGAAPLALMLVFVLIVLIAQLFGPVRWN